MRVIGLTGGIATGKSTASQLLKEMGHIIIDADLIAREVVEPGQIAYRDIVESFGTKILDSRGVIDRKKLGGVVFSNYEKLSELNEIVHPQVKLRVKELIDSYRNQGKTLVFFDCPLIYESNLENFVDEVWLIYSNEDIQIARILKRDHLTEGEAKMRICAQLSIEEKRKLAHVTIENMGTLSELRMRLVEQLKSISE